MTQAFGRHVGIVAPLMADNIDTDQIIPSREIRGVGRDGLADGLFAGQRYLDPAQRAPDPQFILNREPFSRASILLSGLNFGCGSSREHAVWALVEYGVRAVIAQSFGEIFFNNCVRNGIVPIVASAGDVAVVRAYAEDGDAAHQVAIDLPEQVVTATQGADWRFSFSLQPYLKKLLVSGLDPISLTLEHESDIDDFLRADAVRRPWAYPDAG